MDEATKQQAIWCQDVSISLQRIRQILSTGIFEWENSSHPLKQSAFIEIIIRLRDLMAKSEIKGHPIDFVDDVQITDKVKGVKDLVAKMRDAIGHITTSKNHVISYENRLFGMNYGKGVLGNFHGYISEGEYEDDVAIFIGKYRIYLKRHINRLYSELYDTLVPFLDDITREHMEK